MLTTKLLRRLSLPALGGLLLLATISHGQDDGQDDTTAQRASGPIKPAAAAGKVEVAPGYFLFPIAPGQPGFLAASMGELRPNHFHGGLDIKTGGGVNKPVFASAEGYVSRLKQSAFGYGNVLYITHPNGLTTVYGHLNKFEGAVGAELLRRQYEKQTYELELFFDKGKFPVRRGEEVALSGNTGGSAGPHVHWEVRDAQDRQLNPLQWGGFSEVQDHTGPTLQALAVEPLAITARVRGRFERAVLVPKLQPAPGAATTWPDTVRCFGQVGLLLQGFDRFDNAWNKNGIQRVTVRVNGQPHYQHVIDAVPFPMGTRQVNNFVDYAYARTGGRTLQKLWVEEGNDLPFYTPPGLGQGKLDVQNGQVYRVDFELADAYNNKATAHLVLRGEKPADYARLGAAAPAGRPKLSYEISRNLLHATVLNAPLDTAGQPQYLLLRRGGRQLALRPSYSVGAATTYLYDLRAGLPDSLLLGELHQVFDRQALIPPGRETNYATPYANVVFGPQTLFSNLYLSTLHRADAGPAAPESWIIGTPLVPLYLPLRLTLKPASPPADRARTAIYSVSANGGRAYVGGTWNEAGTQIAANLKQFGQFRLYADTKAPTAQLLGRAGGQLTFHVGDDLSGLASYKLLIGGRFRLLRYEYKNATLFTVPGDTLGPSLHGPAELHLADQAGNEKVIPLTL